MSGEVESSNKTNYDEIDLAELIVELWQEKLWIMAITLLITITGLAYAFSKESIYEVKAQLVQPNISELNLFNQSDKFKITTEEAFKSFLGRLENNDHLAKIASTNTDLVVSTFGVSENGGIVSKIRNLRAINYPSTAKKRSDISPDIYTLSVKGLSKDALKTFIRLDLGEAQKSTTANIREQYLSSINSDIDRLNEEITARKKFVTSTRQDRLIQLEQAANLARSLNIELPTSLNKLGLSKSQTEIEINNSRDQENAFNNLLYLRGSKLLNAEINNLKNFPKDVFLDAKIRTMETEKSVLHSKSSIAEHSISFYVKTLEAPEMPIEPNKTLILAVSILAGGILGFFTAIGKIIYKRYKKARSIE